MTDTVRSDIQTRDRFAHEAVFYDGSGQHAQAVLPFIRDGVEADEPVLVALLPDAVAEVRDELGDAGRAVSFLDMADLGEMLRLRRRQAQISPLLAGTVGPVDWADAFSVELPPGAAHDPEHWRRRVFGDTGARRRLNVMKVRDAVVARLGLKPAGSRAGSTAFPLLAADDAEVVLGLDDRHLDFRVSLVVETGAAGARLVVTTAVRRHNLLGRAYFLLIRPAHHFLVPRWVRRAVAS